MQMETVSLQLEALVQSLADPAKRNETFEGLKNYIKNLEDSAKTNSSAESFVLIGRVGRSGI